MTLQLGPEPMDADDVTRHVQADPALRANMLKHKLIWWFMGKYYLTAKGKLAMQARARARAAAVDKGLVQEGPAND